MTSPPDRRLLWLVPTILAGLSILGPFSIDTPFPAFPEMAEDFHVTSREMQLVVSAYLVAFGVMSPFHGLFSDALGRRKVTVGGVLLYAAARARSSMPASRVGRPRWHRRSRRCWCSACCRASARGVASSSAGR